MNAQIDPEIIQKLTEIDSRINSLINTNIDAADKRRFVDRINSVKDKISNRVEEEKRRKESFSDEIKRELDRLNSEINDKNDIDDSNDSGGGILGF